LAPRHVGYKEEEKEEKRGRGQKPVVRCETCMVPLVRVGRRVEHDKKYYIAERHDIKKAVVA
jgi:hypothetical protein